MALPFVAQLGLLAVLAFASGLLMGLSLFRGEIGPRPVAPMKDQSDIEPTEPAPAPIPPEARAPTSLSEKAQSVARLMGPAGLMMAGMLLVLIFGSLLIDWLA